MGNSQEGSVRGDGAEGGGGDGGGGGGGAPGKVMRSERAYTADAAGSGAPLPAAARARFETSVGADLSSVRVHTGEESAQAASAMGARAFATGQDIHFGAGQYQPEDPFGLHLLAHEVAHTVQQGDGAPRAKLEVSQPGDASEVEADRAADAMVAGAPAAIGRGAGAGAGAGAVIARQPADAPAGGGGAASVFVDFKQDGTWDPEVVLGNLRRLGAVPPAMETAIREGVKMTAVFCIDLRGTVATSATIDAARRDSIVNSLNSRINELTYATTRSPQTYVQLAQVGRWSEELATPAQGGAQAGATTPGSQTQTPATAPGGAGAGGAGAGGAVAVDAYAAQLAARDGFEAPKGGVTATRQPGSKANTNVGGDGNEASPVPGWRFVRDPFDNTVTAIDEGAQTGIQYVFRVADGEHGKQLVLDHEEALSPLRVRMLARLDKAGLGEAQEDEKNRASRIANDQANNKARLDAWTSASPANATALADYQAQVTAYNAAAKAKQQPMPPAPQRPAGMPQEVYTTACNLWPTDVYKAAGGVTSFPFAPDESSPSWRKWDDHKGEGPKPGDAYYLWDIMQKRGAHMSVFKSKVPAGEGLELWTVSEGGQGDYNGIQMVYEQTTMTFNTATGVFAVNHAAEGKHPLDRKLWGWIDVDAELAAHPGAGKP